MTDKQIIIDGVDVSGCEFYCTNFCNLSNDRNEQLPFAETCSANPNCFYKQLNRKEQECEYLKNCLDKSFKMQADSELWWEKERKDLKTKRDQLKAENEKYKKLKEYLKISEITTLEYGDLVFTSEVFDELAQENAKLKQALDEIEEYLKTQLDGFGNAVYSVDKSAIKEISDIINKAKEQE